MLKLKNKIGKLIGILKDEASEPNMIEYRKCKDCDKTLQKDTYLVNVKSKDWEKVLSLS